MTKLSEATWAVIAAYGDAPFCGRPAIAAALRAAVEQVLYEEKLGWTGYGYYTHFQNQILAIADELEAS